jgi:flagellar protein FliO/FliZ
MDPGLNRLAACARYPDRSIGKPATQMTAHTLLLVIGVLIGVIAVIGVVAKLVQFSGWPSAWPIGWRPQPRSGRTLILRESIALDPRRRIHLVQCGQRQVVLLTGGGQDLVIGWMQDP